MRWQLEQQSACWRVLLESEQHGVEFELEQWGGATLSIYGVMLKLSGIRSAWRKCKSAIITGSVESESPGRK